MKFKIIAFIFAFVLLFTACGASPQKEPNKHILQEPLQDKTIAAPQGMKCFAVYKNMIFVLTQAELLRINTATDETKVLMPAHGILNIACDEKQLAIAFSEKIVICDYDGVSAKEIELERAFEQIDKLFINKNDVAIFYDTEATGELFYLDIENESLSDLGDTWKQKKKILVLQSLCLFGDKTMEYVISGMFGYIKLEYNLETKAVTQQRILENIATIHFGEMYSTRYNAKGGVKVQGRIVHISDDLTETNLLQIPDARIPNSDDIVQATKYLYVVVWGDNESFVLYDDGRNEFWCTSTMPSNTVTLLMPDFGVDINIAELSALFYNETGKNLSVVEYSTKEYNQTLSQKLLAGQSDFDMFITADNKMLQSVLLNKVYHPIQGYPEIMKNFEYMHSGIKDIVTLNGDTYGYPLETAGSLGSIMYTEYDIPENWTVDDMFEICDGLKGTQTTLYPTWNGFLPVVNCFVTELSKNGFSDYKSLEELFSETLRCYKDGTIFDKSLDNSLQALDHGVILTSADYINQHKTFLLSDSEQVMKPVLEFGTGKRIGVPTKSGQSYAEISNVLFINPKSEKKDDAAKLIELISSENMLYSPLESMQTASAAVIATTYGKQAEKYPDYAEWNEMQHAYLNWYSEHYEGSEIYYLTDEIEAVIADSLYRVLLEEVSPKNAASELINNLMYYMYE